MRHAILGAGGVGGFLAAVLGQAGQDIVLVLRPESVAAHPDKVQLESPLGPAAASVTKAASLDSPVDILWVTVKATQLSRALDAVQATSPGAVVPLLNGIDHLEVLRSRFGRRVIPATIAGEFERIVPGRIVHRSKLARLAYLAAGTPALAPATQALTAFGCRCDPVANEATLMWSKLVLLGPFALATTAAASSIGAVRDTPAWRVKLEASAREAVKVARAEGAPLDEDTTVRALHGFEGSMRSSMQKDVAAARPPELDAIAGPILRGGERHGIAVSATRELAGLVSEAARSRRS